MHKLPLFILAALIAPQVTFGAVMFDNSTLDGSSVVIGQGTYAQQSFCFPTPAGNGSTFAHDRDSIFYTTTNTITKLRLSSTSGTPSYGSSGNSYIWSPAWAESWAISGGTSIGSDGNGGTIYEYNVNIPSGKNLSILQLYAQSGDCVSTVSSLQGIGTNSSWSATNAQYVLNTPALQLCDSGGCSGGFTPPTDGITETIEPTPDSVYLTNPVPFNGIYNNGIDNFYNLVQVRATTTALTDPVIFQYFIATSTGSGLTYSITRNLPVTGMYGYEIRLMDTVGVQFQTPWVYGGQFGLATTTTETSDIFVTPVDLTCEDFDLFCYMKKAFTWLLYPSSGLIQSYTGLLETLQSKPPIGYFTIVKDNILGLNASSTPAVTIVVPTEIKEVIFDPIDIALGGILWAGFAFLFYKRLKHITI